MLRRRCYSNKKKSGISFVNKSVTVKIGETLSIPVKTIHVAGTVAYTANPDSIIDILNESRESVDVTGIAEGTTALTATIGDYSDICDIKVIPIPTYSLAMDQRVVIATGDFYAVGRLVKNVASDTTDLTQVKIAIIYGNQQLGWGYCKADGWFTILCYGGALAQGVENIVRVMTPGLTPAVVAYMKVSLMKY